MAAFTFTNAGALRVAFYAQSYLPASHIRLFKQGFVPTPANVLADFLTHECDYDGYPANGNVVANWTAPLLTPGGGASIESGVSQFAYVGGGTNLSNVVAVAPNPSSTAELSPRLPMRRSTES